MPANAGVSPPAARPHWAASHPWASTGCRAHPPHGGDVGRRVGASRSRHRSPVAGSTTWTSGSIEQAVGADQLDGELTAQRRERMVVAEVVVGHVLIEDKRGARHGDIVAAAPGRYSPPPERLRAPPPSTARSVCAVTDPGRARTGRPPSNSRAGSDRRRREHEHRRVDRIAGRARHDQRRPPHAGRRTSVQMRVAVRRRAARGCPGRSGRRGCGGFPAWFLSAGPAPSGVRLEVPAGDGHAAVLAERPRGDLDADRALAALVLGALDHPDHARARSPRRGPAATSCSGSRSCST